MKTLHKLLLTVAIAIFSVNSVASHYVGINLTSSTPRFGQGHERVHYPHFIVGITPNQLISLEFGAKHTQYNKDDLNIKFRVAHVTALASIPIDGDNFKILYGIGLTKVLRHNVRTNGASRRDVKKDYQHHYKTTGPDGTKEESYRMESSIQRVIPLKLNQEKLFPHFVVGIEKALIPNLYLRTLFSWHNYRALRTNEPFINNLHLLTIGIKYTYK